MIVPPLEKGVAVGSSEVTATVEVGCDVVACLGGRLEVIGRRTLNDGDCDVDSKLGMDVCIVTEDCSGCLIALVPRMSELDSGRTTGTLVPRTSELDSGRTTGTLVPRTSELDSGRTTGTLVPRMSELDSGRTTGTLVPRTSELDSGRTTGTLVPRMSELDSGRTTGTLVPRMSELDSGRTTGTLVPRTSELDSGRTTGTLVPRTSELDSGRTMGTLVPRTSELDPGRTSGTLLEEETGRAVGDEETSVASVATSLEVTTAVVNGRVAAGDDVIAKLFNNCVDEGNCRSLESAPTVELGVGLGTI